MNEQEAQVQELIRFDPGRGAKPQSHSLNKEEKKEHALEMQRLEGVFLAS